MRRIRALGRYDLALAVLIVVALLMRLFLSGQPYWSDELLSVQRYGTAHPDAFSAIADLMEHSIHPPLYQFILWNWMSVFGDSEVATRTLSSLYVAGATLCLYLGMRMAHSARAGFAAALFFSLMYAPFYYGLEARSYAQSLFLASLSSLALLGMMASFTTRPTWRSIAQNGWVWTFVLANFGLLMTHYFNAFLLGGQGVFFAAWFLLRDRFALASFLKVAVIGVTPLLLFVTVWMPTLIDSYGRFAGGRYDTQGALPTNPLTLFHEVAVDSNFHSLASFASFAPLVLQILIVVALAYSVLRIGRNGWRVTSAVGLYFASLVIGSIIFAYLLFSISGEERVRPRFFTYLSLGIAPLLALAIEAPFRWAARFKPAARAFVSWAPALTLLVALVVFTPDAYRAATEQKVDVRSTARLVAAMVERNRDQRYIIYETASPLVTYYLAKMNTRVRVRRAISGHEERRARMSVERDAELIAEHDYLILIFVRTPTRRFPRLLEYMDQHYELEHNMLLTRNNNGILIYRIHPEGGASGAEETPD